MAVRIVTLCIALSMLVLTGCRTRSNYQPCPTPVVAAAPACPAPPCPTPGIMPPPPGAIPY